MFVEGARKREHLALMAIPWKPPQKLAVVAILDEHRLNSANCKKAANEILPIAKQVDPQAMIFKITPKGRERYVVPTVKTEEPWYDHYSTALVEHCVDVLTGPDGTHESDYWSKHWEHAECLKSEAV